jgi:predicted MFS family arabinose efflux permease
MTNQVDRPQAIAGAILLSCLGVLAVMLMPVLIGALVAAGIAPEQAGYIGAAEALGTALGCVLAAFWIQRIDWRLAAGFAIAVVVVGNLLTAVLVEFSALLALRFLIGLLGEGTAFAVAMSVLGSTTQKDRNFAFAIAAQVLVGVLAFQLNIPREIWGVPGVVIPVAIFAGLILITVPWVPRLQAGEAGHGSTAGGGAIPGLALAALLTMLIWCTGLGAIWAFIQLIGESGGIEPVQVGQALGLSTLIGTSGALAASALAGRVGRLLPVTIALLVQVAMLTLLRGEMIWLQFLLTAATFQIFWNMIGPYMMGTIALSDSSGRAAVLIPAAQIGGFFVGPVIAGQFLTQGAGYWPANVVAIACCLIALLLFIPVARAVGR